METCIHFIFFCRYSGNSVDICTTFGWKSSYVLYIITHPRDTSTMPLVDSQYLTTIHWYVLISYKVKYAFTSCRWKRSHQQQNSTWRPHNRTTQWTAYQMHAEGYQQGICWHMVGWSNTDSYSQQSAVWPKSCCWWKKFLMHTQQNQIVSSTCLCTRYSFCGRTAEKVHKVVRSKRRINHIKSNSEYLLYCLYNFCIDWLIGYYCEKYQKKCKVTYNHVFFCRSIVK